MTLSPSRSLLTLVAFTAASGVALAADRIELPDATPSGAVFDFHTAPDLGGRDGNGCSDGSFDWEISSDQSVLRLRFYDFDVYAGAASPGGGDTESKYCRLDGTVRPPTGWTMGIEAVEVSARAWLADSDSMGSVTAGVWIPPARYPVDLVRRTFRGPYDGDFALNGWLSRDRIQWTPCGGNFEHPFEINASLGAQASGFADAAVTGTERERAVVHEYRLVWARCSSPQPPPPSQGWTGQCRVVHETVWGTDLRDYWGYARSSSQSSAVSLARRDGQNQCEYARQGDAMSRCTVVESECFATLGRD